ncbi:MULTISPECIES: CD225/dispanin family protein [Synechocystis]|uniref:CD225/dispanin family protein n=1 Tax=Synechocystis salina LEGE 00031 TaxID=1828736 RepID=A0ABR9VRL2_9SYNC|nr:MULTISPECIES: CD225/dispanin family protein [Synechocystis]MBD2654841.1 CD225/dispanin family protein [Synechocystis sp. FACHB-383]MBE9195367.1 CD225/dispanin family protein [Synechocystis sp. LEGE 06083]MBE9240616.1 CD225/dispanin family protein [Synechocystis salina LEGE 00041]MBE9253984.1 CD225/dispanin family protein [Synechocystis salina LEGE 00031]
MTNQNVPNYLAQSILVTLFCCLPLGIVAIIKASEVNSRLASGDYEGAVRASNEAKKFCWWSFGAGIIFVVIYIVLAVLAAIFGQ